MIGYSYDRAVYSPEVQALLNGDYRFAPIAGLTDEVAGEITMEALVPATLGDIQQLARQTRASAKGERVCGKKGVAWGGVYAAARAASLAVEIGETFYGGSK